VVIGAEREIHKGGQLMKMPQSNRGAVTKKNGWIGVDLDGTLAKYEGWVSPGHIGEPVPAMVTRVKKLLAQGYDVRIFTARIDATNPAAVKKNIQEWCKKNIGRTLPITNVKDLHMIRLYDDRAVQVEFNTGKVVGKES
jgi:hypothetical protein